MAPTRHVVLVGMMGTGKTTVGRAVARRLLRPFVDSDEVIEARTGRTVRELFEADGEPAFRRLETAALLETLAEPEPLVIAAAGGTVVDATNRLGLDASGALVIWLRADPAELARRVRTDDHRPLLDGHPESALRELLTERERWYAGVAQAVVDTDELAVDDVVTRVLYVIEETRD